MINPLPRKEFEINLADGTVIKGKFGTWALHKFCTDNNCSLEDAGERLKTLPGIVSYLLCAVQCVSRKDGTPFSYTDIQACDWIDEMGGVGSENFAKLMKLSGDENAAVDDEKKTDI